MGPSRGPLTSWVSGPSRPIRSGERGTVLVPFRPVRDGVRARIEVRQSPG